MTDEKLEDRLSILEFYGDFSLDDNPNITEEDVNDLLRGKYDKIILELEENKKRVGGVVLSELFYEGTIERRKPKIEKIIIHEYLKKILSYILEGNVTSIEEAIECSSIELPNYKILKKKGEGAFKKVYLAESKKSSGYYVVLKLVNPSQFGIGAIKDHYPSFKDWLTEELQITKIAELDSRYVVVPQSPIEGEDGKIYLVEEPFEETLRDKIERSKRIDIDEVLELSLQITKGLKDSHNHGKDKGSPKFFIPVNWNGPLIHKDLKPSNIGLDKNGNIKLTDYGSLESMSISQRDSELSNILYSAPEVLNRGKTTIRSNIYTLGVLIYEMLFEEHPYVPRDTDEKPKQKPKNNGQERNEYKKEILDNIAEISKLSLEDRFEKIKSKFSEKESPVPGIYDLLGGNSPISRMLAPLYIALFKIISGCLSYKQEDRIYLSMEELEDDIAKVISYNDSHSRTLIVKYDLITNPNIEYDNKNRGNRILNAMSSLYKYKDEMNYEDYSTINRALITMSLEEKRKKKKN